MLDNDDIKAIKNIVEDRSVRVGDTVTQNITKVGIALCISGILWIMVGVSEMKQDMAVSKDWRISVTRQMEGFNKFMTSPRFTREDYLAENKPIELELLQIKDLIKKLPEVNIKLYSLEKEVKRLYELESKIHQMKVEQEQLLENNQGDE